MGVLYARVAGAWVAIPAGPAGPEGPMGPPALSNSVYVATTGNIALSGSPTIDNVEVPAGMRVLVKNQTDITQNGIWISAAGSWTRAPDMDQGSEVHGTTVYVEAGAQQNNTLWAVWAPAANDTGFAIGQGILFTRIGVQPPAYVGEWRTALGVTDGNRASFSSLANNMLKEGVTLDQEGVVRFYSSKTAPASEPGAIAFLNVGADHVTEQWLATINPGGASAPSGRQFFQIGDACIGNQPAHTMWGLWSASAPDGNSYWMMRGGGGELYLNCGAGNFISLRSANGAMMDVRSSGISTICQVSANYTSPNNDWTTAHFRGYPQQSSADQARVALHSPGVAPQIRCVASNGEQIGIVNSNSQAWARLGAASFETNSSITAKREVRELGVRPLRMERERIVVHHDAQADEVPDLDIMALRPIAFRPKIGAQRLVPPEGKAYADCEPEELILVPQIGILGHEGSRERLGLIAEEVETIVPSAVTHDCDGNALGIDYAQVTVALLDHVQQLTRTVETLQYRIAELEGRP